MPRIAAAVTVVIVIGTCIGFNTVRYPVVWKMVAGAHQPPRPEKSASESQSAGSLRPQPPVESASPIALIPDSSDTPLSSAGVDPIPFPAVLKTGGGEWPEEGIASPENVAATRYGDPFRSRVSEESEDVPREPPVGPADSYELASSRDGGYGEQESRPVAAAPSMKYASGAAEDVVPDRSAPGERLARANRRPLVPVASADRYQYNAPTAGEDRSPELGAGDPRTRRLDRRVQRLPPLDRTWEPPGETRELANVDGPIPIYPSTHDD